MPIYKNKGVVYNIPDDKRAEYEQANPAAKIMVNVQGDITSLPPQAAKQYADMGIVSMVDRAGWAAHKKHRDSNPLSDEEAGKAKQRIMTALQGGNVVTPSLASMGQDMTRPRPLVPKAEVGEAEKADVVTPRVDGIRYAEDMYKVDAPDVVKPMGERASKAYDIDAEVGEAEKAYNKAYREALSEETGKPQTFTQKFQEAMRMQDMGAVGGTNAELVAEKRPEVQQAYATYKLLDDAREIQEQARRNTRGETGFITNALYALKDNVFDPEQWDMGVKNAGMEVALQHVVEKSEKNMPLTESEDRLLEASITNMMVQQAYADMVGRGYAAGKVTAESLPFMLEMLANPVSGVGKGLAKGIARAALKKYGKEALKTIGGKVARGVVATGGNVVSAAGMAATTGVPRVAGDAARRIREGEVTGTAFSKAFGANVIEILTEMLGWQMAGAGKAVRGGIAKITPRKVTEIVGKVQSNDLVSAVSNVIGKAGWQGLPEEYLEEVGGTVLNSIFVGDSSLADLVDVEKQVETFLGVSILGGAIATAKTAGYGVSVGSSVVENRKAKKQLNNAEQTLNSLMTDDVAGIKAQIDNAAVEDMEQAVMAAITNPAVNAEQKMALVSYAGAVAKIKAMEAEKDKQRAEGTRTPERDVIEQSYEQGAEAQGADKHTYELEYQKVVKDLGLTAEQIDELDAIEDPATYIYNNPDRADELSRYYTAKARRDGMVDEAETRIQQAEDSAGAAVDDITHTDGNVYRATLASGEEVTISRGKVVIGDDGDIDKTTSDARYVVRTQDGAVRMVGAEEIKSVTSVRSGAEEKTVTMEEVREAATRQEEDEIDGVNTWQIGVPMAVVYVNGERGTLAIESIDGDTYTAVNEVGERVVMSREDIVDAVNRAEIDPAAIEIGTMGTAVIGGKEVDVTVSGEVDADGNVPVDIYNTDGNVVGMRSIPVDSFKPIQSRKGEPKEQQQPQQEETSQEPTSQVGDEAAETEQAPVIPTDKKGRKLYEDVPVGVTINDLMTVLGTEDVVRDVVADTIEGLNEDLQKEQSKGKSSDINTTIATKQRIAELQRKLDYWTEVQRATTTPVEENVEEPEVAPEEQGAEPIVEETTEEPIAEVPEAEGETPTEGIEGSETSSVVDAETLQLRMSEEEFNNLLQNGTIEELQEYKNELNGILEIKEGGIWSKSMEIDAEYRKAVEQYGSADAVPQDVIEGLKQRKQPYTNLSNEIYRRIYALGDEIDAREVAKLNEQTQREQEEKETHRKDAYNGFMADMTAVKAGQVDKALSKKINIDGTVATIAEHIERWDKDGSLATSTSEVNKYKGVSRRAYNRMDAAQQRAEDERVKNGGTKTEYYVNDYSLGKTAYDYAQYLLSKKESQPTEQNETEAAEQQVPVDVESADVTGTAVENEAEDIADAGEAEVEAETEGGVTDELDELDYVSRGAEQAFDEIQKTQGEIKPTAKKRKGDIWIFTSKEKERPVLMGVYHDPDGYAVASNATILLADKEAYDAAKSGKVVDKNGNEIQGNFPRWQMVVPKEGLVDSGWDIATLTEWIEGVKQAIKEKKLTKREVENTRILLRTSGGKLIRMKYEILYKFIDGVNQIGAKEILYAGLSKTPMLVAKNDRGVVLAMSMPVIDDYNATIAYHNYAYDGKAKSKKTKKQAGKTGSKAKKAGGVEKIEDVGEKIGGAKKDLFAESVRNIKEDAALTDAQLMERIESLPVSKIFNFDLAKLREGGMTNEQISFIAVSKKIVPAKPRKTSKVRRWVNNVMQIYRICLEAGTNWWYVEAWLKDNAGNELAQMYDAYMSVGGYDSGLNIGDARLRQLGAESYRFEGSERVSLAGQWYVAGAGRHGGIYKTREEAVEALKAFAGENAMPKGKKPIKFVVYMDVKNKTFFITPEGKNGIVIQAGFNNSKEAFDYIKEHQVEMQERYMALREDSKGTFKDNRERKGRDYLSGGDIQAEDFRKTFGFRGVEFGNWMTTEDRQKALNECYNALMDLAQVLKVSPKALSLGGSLAMAFGARGGGKFSAHYEPTKVVINHTKTKGAGSLAHEWWHALDHYFAMMGGLQYGFATHKEGLRPDVISYGRPGDEKYFDRTTGNRISKEEYDERTQNHGVRQEMAQAWEALMDKLNKSDYATRSKAYDDLHNSSYWSKGTEMGARAFAVWVANKLSEQNAHNDYLANNPHLTKEQIEQSALLAGVFPYPFDEDAEWMNEGFGNLFEVMQEKVEENNVVLYQVANEVLSNTTEAQKLATEAVLTALDKAGVEVIEATPEMVEDVIGEEVQFMSVSEAKRRAEEIQALTPIEVTANTKTKEELKEDYNNLPGVNKGGNVIQFYHSAFKKIYKDGGLFAQIIPQLDTILDQSVLAYSESDNRVGQVRPDGSIHKRHPNVSVFHNYVGKIEIEGKEYYVRTTVQEELAGGFGTHSYMVTDVSLYENTTNSLSLPITTRTRGTIDGIIDTKLQQFFDYANGSNEIPQFHRVYHGSGTLFDEFDHSFIGTGEGHQAFGWGTYVTEVRSIGESYASELSKPVFLYKGERVDTESFSSPYRVMADLYHATNGKLTEMRAMAKKYASSSREFGSEAADLWGDVLSILNETRRGDIKISKGKVLYTVEIPNDIDGNYIEYDASVGEDIVEKVGAEMESKYGFKFSHKMEGNGAMVYEKDGEKVVLNPKASGADLYEELSDALGEAKEASSFLSEVGFTGISYQAEHLSGGRAVGAKNYVIFNEKDLQIKDVVEMMRTPQGTVYGWTVGGKIYLTPAGMNANTPIHEYTHLWANAMMQKNPKGWESVKNLLKGTPVWDAVMTDEAYADIRSNEDLVASEVLSRISGRENARKMEAEAQKMIDEANGVVGKANAVTLLSRMKEALQKFWNWVGKDLFGIETFDSIEEVTDRVLYDLLSGTDLKRGVAAEENVLYRTSAEIDEQYPNWLEGTTTDSGKHSTQVEGTRKTYNKVGDWIEKNLGKDVSILDASSGMGYGTMDLRERGFNIEDVEPYQSEKRKKEKPATYSSYGDIENQYDVVISNAVLNVIPDDWRENVLHDMANRLKPGGMMFINTRKAGEEKNIKDKIELDNSREVLVKRNGKIASYQRFFTPNELKNWVENELGSGYSVEIANEKNSGTKGLAAVVVYKADEIKYREPLNEEQREGDIEAVNERFNKELQQQIDGTLPEGHIYNLGLPSDVLLSTGVSNAPIQLNSSRLKDKSMNFGHDYDLSEIKDLVLALNNPIAIFSYGNKNKAQNIVVEIQHEGKNFIVGISIRPEVNGMVLDINSIRNVFPKDNAEWLNWITQGKALYLDKKRVQTLIDQQQTNLADVAYLDLNSVAKIVEEFENPTLPEKINISIDDHIKEKVAEQAASLGEAVEFVTAEQMPKGKGRAKGYYKPRTGKVVVNIAAHKSVEDACRTVFHEIVGHKGLRAVMGERFDSFLDSVYKGMGWRVRSGIDRETAKYIAKGESEAEARRHATEEYVARMAEDGFNPRNVTVWTRIADILKNALMEAKIYLGFGLSNRDVRYALWKSYDMQMHKGAIAAARDVVMREKEGIIDDADGNRYREAEEVVDITLNEWYDNEVKSFGYRLREGYQDGMLALKKVQEQIAKQTGSPIEDYEDAYTAQNQAVSKSKEEQYWYKERFFKPMVDAVVALMGGANISYKQAIDYILSKSGIERNSTLAWRDAVEEYRTAEGRAEEGEPKTAEQIEEEIVQIERKEAEIRRSLSERYRGKMTSAYIAALDAAREDLIPGYAKYRKKDYSGLTSLTAEEGEEVSLQDAEKRAFEYVEEVEDRCEDLCSDLWDKINQATKATLRKSYTSGILSKAEYDKVRGMFQYYVPMRGWEEETAADVYDYITKGSGYAPTVRRAEGRKSVADDPIATIGNMADSAIIAGNKNLMKQKLLSLAINRPTSLFTVGGVWYVKDGKEWKESFPEIPDNAIPEEVAQIIQAHEEEMQHRRAEGTARRKKEAPHLTRIATKKEQSQHAIRVKRGGVEYVVYVNGDPRIAQAINGELTKREKEGWKKAWEKLNRILAANFTTRNPSFVLRNLSRDIMFATTAVAVKEDKKYLRKFMENGGKNLNIWNLLHLYKAGKLDENNEQHRYFKEFMENGGETGYTAINDVDAYKREIAGILAEAQGRTNFSELLGTYIEWSPNLGWAGTPVKGVEAVVKFLGLMNRGAEDISRFTTYMTSRQMGRSVQQSVANAKDITVNFNRKGNGTMGADMFKLLYLFFNASIQGAHTLAKLMKHNPKKSIAAIATTGVIGVVMPMLNDVVYEIMGGDDEDGNMKYEDLPEWVRRNNICLKVGLDRWVTIPVSIELRPVYGIGDVAIQYAKGNIDGSNAAKDIVSQMMAVSPIDLTGGGYDLVANLVPDVIKPLAQAYTNKDYFGKPIYRDNGYNEAYPEYTKAYKSTNDVLVDMSKWINDITGGDEVTPGMVDINPGVVEHIIEGYMGGLGKTISQMTKTVQMIGDEEKRMWRNVPVVNAFLTEAGDVSYRLNNLYFKYTDQADELSRREREYRKRVNEGQEAYMAKYEELVNSKDWEKVGVVKYYKKQVNKLYTAQKEYGDSKEIADMIVMLKAQMIDEVRQIDGK